LRGEIQVPGDKSISHRSLLLNALATSGEARIHGLLRGEDVLSTLEAVRALGAEVVDEGDSVTLRPQPWRDPEDVVDCGNSGTTMRLLTGALASSSVFAVLTGDSSLRRRPMGRVVEPLRAMGAEIAGRSGGALAPLAIQGRELAPTAHDLSIASAQVKTALLLAGRRCGVRVREPATSRDHTERMLRAMGAKLAMQDGWLQLDPGGWQTRDVQVPGDVSSAAFWLVAGSIVPDSAIRLTKVGLNPTRAGIVDALVAMGADIQTSDVDSSVEPYGTLGVRTAALRGTRIDGELALRCLDELPVLAIAAAFAEGETVIADAEELRVKESDRIATVVRGLKALGVAVEERPDGMVIQGGGAFRPASVDATGDHRIAMAFSVAALAGGVPVSISGADSILTSYPSFWEHIEQLSGSR